MHLILFIFGSVIFSFINVMVIRMQENRDFVFGRSRCDVCGHELTFLDTFPLIGFALLKGKCRYCGNRISVRNPIVEAFGGILLCSVYQKEEQYILYFIFYTVLCAAALYDLDTMEIPDMYLIILFMIGLIIAIREGINADNVLGMTVFSFPMIIVYLLNKGIGEGDIILSAITGFTLGYEETVHAMTVCYISAGIIGLFMVLIRKKEMKCSMPFAPFIAAGCIAVLCVS